MVRGVASCRPGASKVYGIRLRDRSAFPRGGEIARSRPGKLDKKNRQFLAKPAGTWYCFSERPTSPARTSDGRRATGATCNWAFGLRAGNGSGMAPQAIEIAQNGLGDPPARGRREGESIRRIPYHWFRDEACAAVSTDLSRLVGSNTSLGAATAPVATPAATLIAPLVNVPSDSTRPPFASESD
jgi:hypothetical protein